MSYYSKIYGVRNNSWFIAILPIIICFALIFALMFGFNCCSYQDWNDGVCPECNLRYELKGVSKYMKYYACPKCGNEVQRY